MKISCYTTYVYVVHAYSELIIYVALLGGNIEHLQRPIVYYWNDIIIFHLCCYYYLLPLLVAA